ncbi:MAG: hypothetical protein ABWZ26_07225 [Candidatus Nanopelagicales bacterium]
MHPTGLAAAALSLALALAGCTSGSGDGSLADQTDRSTASESAASSSPVTNPEELFMRVSAAASEAGSVRTSFTSASAAGDVSGEGLVRFGSDYAADLTVSAPGGTAAGAGGLRAVIVDETFYLQGGSEIGLPAGKTWISLTAADDSPLATSLAPLVTALATAGDMEQSFAALRAGTQLRVDGQEDIDGVATTKYVVTVDVAQAITVAGSAAGQFQALEDLGVAAFDYAIWVGDDDLPRQYEHVLDIGGGTTTRANYTDWGTTVAISAPPAEQVASLAELLGTG